MAAPRLAALVLLAVFIDGQALNKPADLEAARQMLRQLTIENEFECMILIYNCQMLFGVCNHV